MREILFRGKRIDNGEWVQGDLVHVENKSYISYYYESPLSIFINEQIKYDGILIVGVAPFIEVDIATIGQYTGLTDKNGKKIFEGDILKIIHKYQSPFDDDTKEYTDITTDVVFFDDEGLCFSYGKSPFLCVVDNVTAEYEVIGNIHDNPELLEVTE